MTGAAFARGASKQDYGTPRSFLDAVEARFGKIVFDLAAHSKNKVVPRHFGPGGEKEDALVEDWAKCPKGNLWLNPPFNDLAPWVKKCAATLGRSILFLMPASVGSNWFAEHVDGKAWVYFIRPRLSFDGKNPYPNDCLLAVYGDEPGYECWRYV